MIIGCFLVLEAQRAVSRKFHFFQGLENARDIKVALADDYAVRPFFLLGEIFQVNAV